MAAKLSEKATNIRQMPFRMHLNDKVLFMKLLSDYNLSYQSFADACMQAFMRADPSIMKVIKDWRALNVIPKQDMNRYTLSHRERNAIQNELDSLNLDNDSQE